MDKSIGKVLEGSMNSAGMKIGIVCGRFNEFFVSKLLSGAVDAIVRHGGASEDITAAWVPGSYEIPFAVNKMLQSGKYDAIIALGVVIQGATPHASYINNEVAKSLAQLGMQYGKPVTYGMITADNIEQAIERSGTKAGNKGVDAALAAIEMVNLSKVIEQKMDFDNEPAKMKLHSKRLGREMAMQFLFQCDINGVSADIVAWESFFEQIKELHDLKDNRYARKGGKYAETLFSGVVINRDAIDASISERAANWNLERLSLIELNLMRIAVYEMIYEEDVPAVVSINEAVEIAMDYSGDKAGSFINGVLNGIKNALGK